MGDDVLARTRLILGGLVAGPLVLTAVLAWTMRAASPPPQGLSTVATLLGLAAGPWAWRLHRRQAAPILSTPPGPERERRFFVSRVVPVAVTEAAALLGGLAYAWTRESWTVAGLAVHLLVAAAIWPREAARDELQGPRLP